MLFNIVVNTLVQPAAHGIGLYLLPPGWELVKDGNIQIAINHQCKRAWNRRGGHYKQMGAAALIGQRGALAYAKTVLFIRDN